MSKDPNQKSNHGASDDVKPFIPRRTLEGSTWHGKRKIRRNTYSTPGGTADELWLRNANTGK